MGQPKFLLGLSNTCSIKKRWIEVAILITLLSCLVNAQNCDFNPVDEDTEVDRSKEIWVVVGPKISEKLDVGEIIWNVPTVNIKSSTASTYPHSRYLTGYRYDGSYMYKTSQNFPNFITTEYFNEVQRNVTFTCGDNKTLRVHFKFPLEDINDPPTFRNRDNLEFNVDLDTATEETIINNVPIQVEEIDFTEDNLDVEITSDRNDLLIVEKKFNYLHPGHEFGALYDVELKLNLKDGKDKIEPGKYSLNLFCYDRQYTNSLRVIINVRKGSN